MQLSRNKLHHHVGHDMTVEISNNTEDCVLRVYCITCTRELGRDVIRKSRRKLE